MLIARGLRAPIGRETRTILGRMGTLCLFPEDANLVSIPSLLAIDRLIASNRMKENSNNYPLQVLMVPYIDKRLGVWL